MNIAIVYATFYVRGGAENVIIWLTNALLQRGHQVTIFTSEYDHHDPDMPEAVKHCTVEISAGGNYSTWLDWMLAGWHLRKRFQAFDVVNPHNFPANVWVYFAKRWSRAFPPIVWYCHEPSRLLYDQPSEPQRGRYPSLKNHIQTKINQEKGKFLRKFVQKSLFYGLNACFQPQLKKIHIHLDRQAVTLCDDILANSRYTLSKIQAIYQKNGHVCYQGIPERSIQEFHSNHKKEYFLTVTRLEKLKHVESVIQAVHLLVTYYGRKDCALYIIGKGSQESALKTLTAELALDEQHVIFLGHVQNHDLHRYYAEALAVIYVPEDEPFGLVPLEAMQHKTAVIVSNQGGVLETVANNVTGFHVEPGNAEQLAHAMLTLLRNRTRAAKMGEKGYQHVMAHLTFSHFVDRFEQHLNQLVEKEAAR